MISFTTGKYLSAKQSAWAILLLSMTTITILGLSGDGSGLAVIVLFPVVSLLAILLADVTAVLVVGFISIVIIILFMYLDMAGHALMASPLPPEMADIMWGAWILFSIICITAIGWYYRIKLDAFILELQQQAGTDHLTGLANRRRLEESLHRELSRIRRSGGWLSLLLIDLDHFRTINRTEGHRKGDESLIRFAKAIRNHSKRAIDVVGRYGGDEFMVILPDTGPDEAKDIAEKIRQSIEKLGIVVKGQKISATVGWGSVSEADIPETQALIDKVDDLMYEGKFAGGNIVFPGVEGKDV